jgi:hypothetical protein
MFLFLFSLPLTATVVIPGGRPYCFRIEPFLSGFALKNVRIAGSPGSRRIPMTIPGLVSGLGLGPPVNTRFTPDLHCYPEQLLTCKHSRVLRSPFRVAVFPSSVRHAYHQPLNPELRNGYPDVCNFSTVNPEPGTDQFRSSIQHSIVPPPAVTSGLNGDSRRGGVARKASRGTAGGF